MIRLRDKFLLLAALAALFLAGAGTGYFVRPHLTAPLASEDPAMSTANATSAGDWWGRAMDNLSRDLQLTTAQQDAVRPVLQQTADEVFLTRDRSLFQIHLRLLEFHDRLAASPGEALTDAQRTRLATLRSRLRERIEQRFPQFLKDTPLPVLSSLP